MLNAYLGLRWDRDLLAEASGKAGTEIWAHCLQQPRYGTHAIDVLSPF